MSGLLNWALVFIFLFSLTQADAISCANAKNVTGKAADVVPLEVATKFDDFVDMFEIKFKDATERAYRLNVFSSNLDIIKSLNERKVGGEDVVYGINKFAHLTPQEFKQMLMPESFNATKEMPLDSIIPLDSLNEVSPGAGLHRRKRQSVPANFDWRTYGAVTYIKNQGSCGSCWSFATVAAVESLYTIKNGAVINLSEQELLNCDSQSYGCSWGYTTSALNYVHNYGVHYETAAPYTGAKGTCYSYSGSKVYITGYHDLSGQTESYLTWYLSTYHPFAHGFGIGSDFQYYVSGIYSSSTCPGVNHFMLAIGYGVSSSNVPYWTTKNQWGTGWGESGFMRFRRNVNLCGFTTQNNAPVDIWQ